MLDRFLFHARGLVRDVVLATLLSSTVLLLRGDDAGATYFIISNIIVGVIIHFVVTFFGGAVDKPNVDPRRTELSRERKWAS